MSDMIQRHDVVAVGGGAAGPSGVPALSRARCSARVIDAGLPNAGLWAGVVITGRVPRSRRHGLREAR